MAEEFVLTTPIAGPSLTRWIPDRIDMQRRNKRIHLEFVSNTGQLKEYDYTGDDALNKIKQLNTAPLNVKSLEKRIMELPEIVNLLGVGTIQGSPD